MSEELSDFQKRRLENIKRNNDLLKNLNFKKLPIPEAPKATPKPKTTATKRKKKSTAYDNLPVRRRTTRSTNNIKIPDDFRGIDELDLDSALQNEPKNEEDTLVLEKMKLEEERRKNFRISGDIKLGDYIDSNIMNFDINKISAGDFFKQQKSKKTDDSFDSLELYPHFPPNEIKITDSRISSLFFHPLSEYNQKLIIGGDKEGMLGLWKIKETAQDEYETEIPDINKLKLFKSNIGNIGILPSSINEVFFSSYDGSFRIMDLNSMNCREAFYMNPSSGYEGISDIKFYDDNTVYFTTLTGEFFQHDLREDFDKVKPLRMANKKIGSMDIDPKNKFQIATGSLDRTLKIWDIRKIIKSEDEDDLNAGECIKTYDSRLSISAVSYSAEDHTLVCNGYDNTVRLFDDKELRSSSENMTPTNTITHNCKTGKWTSILKARFKPNKDVFAIANMSRAIDIYNSKGEQYAHLETATVPAVTAWHATENWIAGGNSSGKVFLFTNIY
ncbi:hypothetical protein FOG48_00973 [Hanseniaspora uvarum]|nr:hypothetical protein FOG48_00973 [Hanseniaspora uvarum]